MTDSSGSRSSDSVMPLRRYLGGDLQFREGRLAARERHELLDGGGIHLPLEQAGDVVGR